MPHFGPIRPKSLKDVRSLASSNPCRASAAGRHHSDQVGPLRHFRLILGDRRCVLTKSGLLTNASVALPSLRQAVAVQINLAGPTALWHAQLENPNELQILELL